MYFRTNLVGTLSSTPHRAAAARSACTWHTSPRVSSSPGRRGAGQHPQVAAVIGPVEGPASSPSSLMAAFSSASRLRSSAFILGPRVRIGQFYVPRRTRHRVPRPGRGPARRDQPGVDVLDGRADRRWWTHGLPPVDRQQQIGGLELVVEGVRVSSSPALQVVGGRSRCANMGGHGAARPRRGQERRSRGAARQRRFGRTPGGRARHRTRRSRSVPRVGSCGKGSSPRRASPRASAIPLKRLAPSGPRRPPLHHREPESPWQHPGGWASWCCSAIRGKESD